MEGLDRIERAFQVGVQNGIPVFLFHAEHQGVPRDAGVVHQDVNLREVFQNGGHGFLNGRVIRYVAGVGLAGIRKFLVDFFCGPPAAGWTAADQDDPGSFRSEAARDGIADSAARAGNDGCFTC